VRGALTMRTRGRLTIGIDFNMSSGQPTEGAAPEPSPVATEGGFLGALGDSSILGAKAIVELPSTWEGRPPTQTSNHGPAMRSDAGSRKPGDIRRSRAAPAVTIGVSAARHVPNCALST